MKTRLLGAAVLIALLVLFVPMFFSGSPPAPGGDQTVSLAIPPAPDRDLQTRTMSLDPNAPAVPATAAVGAPAPATTAATAAPGDQLATVNIGSRRPRDVETDPQAGAKPLPTTVTIGSGASPSQPVIPPQPLGGSSPKPRPVATVPSQPAKAPARAPAPVPVATPAATAEVPAAGSDDYTINLSAYASVAGAASLQHRVRSLGYPVAGYAITQAGQSRTLVIAGPFRTRTAAEAARLRISQSIPGVPARLQQGASYRGSAPPAATARSGRPGGWAVQLAAMSSQADADALRDKLRANGFDGFVDSVQSGGQRLWRVRAGPQTQRADAQRVHDQIKARLGLDGNVVSVP
ncbi:MAG: SPOR domain-containing protein [Xanthomonadaceae bacterium]|nr:SPOR domain-containing protein [Xanthomonadaceae bacterium]